jgi:hypothetical protein
MDADSLQKELDRCYERIQVLEDEVETMSDELDAAYSCESSTEYEIEKMVGEYNHFLKLVNNPKLALELGGKQLRVLLEGMGRQANWTESEEMARAVLEGIKGAHL